MNLRAAFARLFRPANSYGSLEERAFAERIRTMNSTGVHVTEHSALSQTPVWACVRVIAESLAMLPVDVVQRSNGRREQLPESPIAWLLNTSPDGQIPAFRFRESLAAHAVLWGNGYAEIERDTVGRPYALHLLTPDRVRTKRDAAGAVFHEVAQSGGGSVRIESRDMLHVAGLGFDGLEGYSVVALAVQALGLGAVMEQFAGAFFGNGMQLGTIYTTDQVLKADQIAVLREQLDKLHKGAGNAFKAAILTGGMKPTDPPMPLTEAQFLEGRRFFVLEVCRLLRVPPHLVAELDRATHTNIEQEQLAFISHCLMPWAVRIESECNLKLFGRNQQARQSVKHNFGALLRGDLASRFGAYKIAREGGWLNANEIRALEDQNGIGPDGDIYLVPANMTTPEKLLEPTPDPVAPPAAPDPASPDEPAPTNSLDAARDRMRLVKRST